MLGEHHRLHCRNGTIQGAECQPDPINNRERLLEHGHGGLQALAHGMSVKFACGAI